MLENLATELIVEENVRREWALANWTVQSTLHFQDESICLVWFKLQFRLLDGTVITSNLWSVTVYIINRVISEASVLVSGLFMDLLMEVIDILSNQGYLFPSSH